MEENAKYLVEAKVSHAWRSTTNRSTVSYWSGPRGNSPPSRQRNFRDLSPPGNTETFLVVSERSGLYKRPKNAANRDVIDRRLIGGYWRGIMRLAEVLVVSKL